MDLFLIIQSPPDDSKLKFPSGFKIKFPNENDNKIINQHIDFFKILI